VSYAFSYLIKKEIYPIQLMLSLSLLFPFSNFSSSRASFTVWEVTIVVVSPIDVESNEFAVL
jgi:hypothetical protein